MKMSDKEIERKISVNAESEERHDKKVYAFDEAIDLTGTGWYNIGLAASTSLSLLAMCIDIFSFSAIVPLCTCDFNLNMMQKSIVLSVPFTGPILTAYAWGYFSDTRGRKLSLVLGMCGSFIISTLCAFSPNWIVLAIFKLISTCFCSCAQSATFALLGESCPEKTKGKLLIVMSSIVHLGMPIYLSMSYLISFTSFSYDLGLITFVPWRLLVIIYALPLGLSATLLMFFYESPKFLLNADREEEALNVLRHIHQRNGRKDDFVVEKMILNEEGNVKNKNVPLLRSLMDQTLPLFKPPLLARTLLMYYLILVVYFVSGGLYVWLPFISHAFTGGDNTTDFSHGLCSTIKQNNNIDDKESETDVCQSVDLVLAIATIISGSSYSLLNALMSYFASRKQTLLILIFTFAGVMCALTTVIPNRGAGLSFFGVLSLSLAMGPLFAYYVDLYPTSFRGMASCLGVMVARISSVLGINLIGPFITTQCSPTFYTLSVFTISGAVVAFLLPSNRKQNLQKQ